MLGHHLLCRQLFAKLTFSLVLYYRSLKHTSLLHICQGHRMLKKMHNVHCTLHFASCILPARWEIDNICTRTLYICTAYIYLLSPPYIGLSLSVCTGAPYMTWWVMWCTWFIRHWYFEKFLSLVVHYTPLSLRWPNIAKCLHLSLFIQNIFAKYRPTL